MSRNHWSIVAGQRIRSRLPFRVRIMLALLLSWWCTAWCLSPMLKKASRHARHGTIRSNHEIFRSVGFGAQLVEGGRLARAGRHVGGFDSFWWRELVGQVYLAGPILPTAAARIAGRCRFPAARTSMNVGLLARLGVSGQSATPAN